MKKLQIALDVKSLEESIEIVKECEEYIDIIEFGTPLAYKYGSEGIKKLKETFKDKKILADFKIMDAGAFETKIAIDAGADIVTVLAVSDNQTIEDSLEEVKKAGKELLVDLICVDNLEERVKYLESIGVDYICVHTGADIQKKGATPLDDLIKVKSLVKNTKVSVAGGVKLETLEEINAQNPDVIIVGGGLVNSSTPKETAKKMKEMIK
ncbi:3-hexulose-6-phosphate synthase [Anaerofustis butyriciformans]|uniref:3-hexulose-6-phosphate synthase n=1 Tax=Anaerofustis TaxID=264995 RepID=UPI003F8CC88B